MVVFLLQHSGHPLWVFVCLSSVPQVLDWIENHGEAFLSKHTGVGKSLHRARALQKRHEDFEEVAQVKTITWRTVHLSWKYMKNSCSGTEGLGRASSTTENSVPRTNYFVSVASFYLISSLQSSFNKKKQTSSVLQRMGALKPNRAAAAIIISYFYYFQKHAFKCWLAEEWKFST